MASLELPCTECECRTPHRVLKTDSPTFHWSEEHEQYFTAMLGGDITYRRRDRACTRCGTREATAELSHDNLRALINEVDRLHRMLSSQDRNRPLSAGQYFAGTVELLAEVFGPKPSALDPRLTWQQADEVLAIVSEFLEATEPDLSAWVRFRYHLWSPPARGFVPSIQAGKAISMLRHPSRSRQLGPAADLCFPERP